MRTSLCAGGQIHELDANFALPTRATTVPLELDRGGTRAAGWVVHLDRDRLELRSSLDRVIGRRLPKQNVALLEAKRRQGAAKCSRNCPFKALEKA